jgi:hypothetical protein
MKHALALAAVVGGLLAVAAGALAAPPTKGGTYVGDIKSTPFTMHIDMKVSPAGTKLLHFTYLCGTGRPPTTVFGIPIDKTGRFAYVKKVGSSVSWKMAGRFVSATKASVSLNSISCGGSKGSTTLTLKT